MRRVQRGKHIDRNRTLINTKLEHGNSFTDCDPISPEMVVGQIWLEDNINTKGIQIIELNSSNTDVSEESQNFDDRNHPWFYNNNERLQRLEETYRINRKAREMRRARNASLNLSNSPKGTTNIGDNPELGDLYVNIASNDDNVPQNHTVNCFTILNKHVINSDTSSDNIDCEDMDILTPRELYQDGALWDRNGKAFEDEVLTYDPEQCPEKRTIWIYSFKNKRLLTENDFELVNIPSNNNTSDSTSSEDKFDVNTATEIPADMCRVSSPFPATYVPKLNLSKGPALSTLTEVTEPNKASSSYSNKTDKSSKDELLNHKHNCWFANDDDSEKNMKKHKATNVISWMALSPRERRRRFRNADSPTLHVNLPTLPETNTRAEVEVNNENLDDFRAPVRANIMVDAVVHTVDKGGDTKSTNTRNKNWMETLSTKEDCDVKIMTSDVEYGDEDRGDYQRKSFRKLHIKLSAKKLVNPVISDPIENLEGHHWIAEGNKDNVSKYVISDEKPDVKTEIIAADVDKNSANHRLWSRNLSLIKPALWTAYGPISDSPMVLHLSIDSLVDTNQTWYKRLFRCFKCCKRNKEAS